MNVLIIEDEKYAAERLKLLLVKTKKSICVLDVLETVEDSINWMGNNPWPDLIFMDIQLADGLCFEIFDTVKVSTPIIFTTAFDAFAIKAFKVNSVDYLLKPVELESLVRAIDKFELLHAAGQWSNEKINHLIDQLVHNYKTRFFVRAGQRFKSIQTSEIDYFFVTGRCTFLKTISGKIYDLDYSLEQLEGLIDPGAFFRINRAYIINIESITEMINYSATRLKIKLRNLEPNTEIFVSRDRLSTFKGWLDGR